MKVKGDYGTLKNNLRSWKMPWVEDLSTNALLQALRCSYTNLYETLLTKDSSHVGEPVVALLLPSNESLARMAVSQSMIGESRENKQIRHFERGESDIERQTTMMVFRGSHTGACSIVPSLLESIGTRNINIGWKNKRSFGI